MKLLNLFLFVLCMVFYIKTDSFALAKQELDGSEPRPPEVNYQIRAGKGDSQKIDGYSNKTALTPQIQPKPNIPNATEPALFIDKDALRDAQILFEIQKNEKKDPILKAKPTNSLALPDTYVKERDNYLREKEELAKAEAANKATQTTQQKRLYLLHCIVPNDYKISLQNRMEIFCQDNITKEKTKIYSSITIKKSGEIEMTAAPKLLEKVDGTYVTLHPDSRLYHGVSGSTNLATYVDTRAIENIQKEMGKTLATSGSQATKNYIAKKNETQSTISQNDSTTVVSTKSPEPQASDYGIGVLVDVISKGVSAGVDQLYQDLGYYYFIAANTPIEAEIYVME